MLVVHVSLTPLAGSPIRIVRALQRHTGVEARLVNLAPRAYGRRVFPEDLAWEERTDEARELVARADVLHFHHWFDFGSRTNPFGFDFLGAQKSGARHLMHWHSSPEFTARNAGVPVQTLLEADLPQLVMAQYHERYYPRARIAPLVVEHAETGAADAAATGAANSRAEHARHAPPILEPGSPSRRPIVMFTPSQFAGAHVERWETKGRPEVVALLERLARRGVLEPFVAHDLPFEECQRRRAQADIVIDDVVTGSYHTTTLESLSLGKPTISWLDARTQAVLAELTGSHEFPIVNAPLEALEQVLGLLCSDAELRAELGAWSRAWSLACHGEARMVAHYASAYEELARTGDIDPRRPREHQAARAFLAAELHDAIWAASRRRFHPERLRVALVRSAREFGRRLRGTPGRD